MLSKTASEADKELATKIILTYCKTKEDEVYTLSYDLDEVQGSPFASRQEVQAYTIL
jgi:tRNA-specific 2-thiouridylase